MNNDFPKRPTTWTGTGWGKKTITIPRDDMVVSGFIVDVCWMTEN
jgi:hypothetical protein